tara:strand:+ start:515 stop:772 length:258 start_codon:yes stop_codon:yes gene_type:complete
MDTPQAIARAYIADGTGELANTMQSKPDAMGVGITIGICVAATILKHYPQLAPDLIATEELSKDSLDELLGRALSRLNPYWGDRN